MFYNPFSCPLMGPLEWGEAELAALPRGRWEEAPALRSRQLPGFGSEQCACDGIWIWQVPHCLLPQQPLQVVAVPVQELLARRRMGTVCVDVAQGPRAGTWAGTCVTAGSGQAGPVLCCVCIYACPVCSSASCGP